MTRRAGWAQKYGGKPLADALPDNFRPGRALGSI